MGEFRGYDIQHFVFPGWEEKPEALEFRLPRRDNLHARNERLVVAKDVSDVETTERSV